MTFESSMLSRESDRRSTETGTKGTLPTYSCDLPTPELPTISLCEAVTIRTLHHKTVLSPTLVLSYTAGLHILCRCSPCRSLCPKP